MYNYVIIHCRSVSDWIGGMENQNSHATIGESNRTIDSYILINILYVHVLVHICFAGN